jgi:cell volume regulation protein A
MIQGWTIRPMAPRLGLINPPAIGPLEKFELELPRTASHELVAYHIVRTAVARGERIPRWARPSLVVRDGPVDAAAICGADRGRRLRLSVRVAPQYPAARPLFASPAHLADDDKDFFGEFYIDAAQADSSAGRVAYGVSVRFLRSRQSAPICGNASAASPRWGIVYRSSSST